MSALEGYSEDPESVIPPTPAPHVAAPSPIHLVAPTERLAPFRHSASIERSLRTLRREILQSASPESLSCLLRDLSPRLLAFVTSYVLMALNSGPAGLIGAAVFAVATVSLVGSWFHDAVHLNPGEYRSLRVIAAHLGAAPLGFSPAWWQYKHVRLHHRFPGSPDFDPDIQFGSVVRVVPGQTLRPWHRFQCFYVWALFPFATLVMLKPGELWQMRRFEQTTGLRSPHRLPRVLAEKYFGLVFIWLPVVASPGATEVLPKILVFAAVSGLLVSFITQVQHNTSLTTDSPAMDGLYPLCGQIARSSDVGTTRGIWWWLCGGVNFHVWHHVSPTTPFLDLLAATQRLEALLARHGMELPRHNDIWQALRSHAALLRQLAHPASHGLAPDGHTANIPAHERNPDGSEERPQ